MARYKFYQITSNAVYNSMCEINFGLQSASLLWPQKKFDDLLSNCVVITVAALEI